MIKTTFLGLDLRSPLIVSSAGITKNLDTMRRAEDHGAGAVIMKGISDHLAMRTSPTPRFTLIHHKLFKEKSTTLYSYEQASEWGPQEYARELARTKAALQIPVLANIACNTPETWVEYVKIIQEAGADAIEINVSCPHGSITFSGDEVERRILEAAQLVKSVAKVPVLLKLSPQLTQPLNIVGEAHRLGLDGVTLFNRLTGLEIDTQTEAPIMHGGYAGHGGAWALNYVLRWISAIAPAVPIQISGSGGVTQPEDVVKVLMAGAQTVQVCSAIYLEGYGVLAKFNRGLERWMEEHGYSDLESFRGTVTPKIKGMNQVEREHSVQAEIQVKGKTPCRSACPLEQEVPGYLSMVAAGLFGPALALVKESNPFPGICGRACHHPCETQCTRAGLDEPLAVAEIKRFLADRELQLPLNYKRPTQSQKVAVVGAGPAGLACARVLAQAGYPVTVFESLPVPGGMMIAGIPAYRLPREVIRREIAAIEALGVEIRCGVEIGTDLRLENLREEFAVVFVATGAQGSRSLGVDGEGLEGVFSALDFLKGVNLNRPLVLGKKVLVIGGGNCAIDAARSARRLGADVQILYRRSPVEITGDPEELEAAEAEGITIQYQVEPVAVVGAGRVQALRIQTTQLVEGEGRRTPIPVPGSERELEADAILVAVGQIPLGTAWGATSPQGEAVNQGIFAGGDVISGPSSLVEAIASGKRAGERILAFLQGLPSPPLEDGLPLVDKERIRRETTVLTRRQRGRELPPNERIHHFGEVRLGFDEEQAKAEAARCLQCAGCANCGHCARICIYNAIEKIAGQWTITSQCDGCGICAYACPHQAIRMVETKAASEAAFGRE